MRSADEIEAVDQAQRQHATVTAEAGAQLVRELGGTAEARPVADSANVAETVTAIISATPRPWSSAHAASGA